MMGKPRAFFFAAVVLLTLAAFTVRAVSLEVQSLWRDEADAMRFATAPLEEVLSNFARHGWNGPLYFLLLRGWIALTGTSMLALRFFSLFFGVLCVPLVYVLGRRLFGRSVGLTAALLVAASPYLTWYSQEVKMYTLVPALVLLAIYALRRAVEGGGWYCWAVQIAATSLALYAHILAAILIPMQVLIAFAWWPQVRRRWLGALISLVCLTLPYLPLAAWQVPLLFDDRVVNLSRQPLDRALQAVFDSWRAGNLLMLRTRVTGFGRFTLGQIVQILLDYWSIGEFGTFGWGWPWGTVLMSVLGVWGVLSPLTALLCRERLEVGKTLALAIWLAFPPLVVWFVSQWQSLFTDRYLIWSALPFYLLIAAGLAALQRLGGGGRWAELLLLGVILSLNGLNQWQQATTDGKADYRGAAAYLAAHYLAPGEATPTVRPVPSPVVCKGCVFETYLPLVMCRHQPCEGLIVFQIPYARYTFDYYFPYQGYPWAEGLYTNHRYPDDSYVMSEANAALAMQKITADYDVVWLFATETWMWDERGLVKAWLDAHLHMTDEAHFKWVDVYRYDR
jgi:4-amino-4-deoxy-L-arabinose transferase-like glycosyltransferase